ncbi:hypothetical protein BJ741DRAFT_187498 [Chytriomyces cf. hyalinus JEL632]|nr:hypothetical protein BJ741DRAFT_187498 [Chytriomyces cf. hyalinus JEL632]
MKQDFQADMAAFVQILLYMWLKSGVRHLSVWGELCPSVLITLLPPIARSHTRYNKSMFNKTSAIDNKINAVLAKQEILLKLQTEQVAERVCCDRQACRRQFHASNGADGQLHHPGIARTCRHPHAGSCNFTIFICCPMGTAGKFGWPAPVHQLLGQKKDDLPAEVRNTLKSLICAICKANRASGIDRVDNDDYRDWKMTH